MLEAHAGDPNVFQMSCEFCDEFAGGLTNSFYARYQGCPRTRFLLSTDNFHVFPSIGQLVKGYLLVAPKKHYNAFDEMPTQLAGELAAVCELVRSIVSQNYGPCISFEHGARGPANGGCGIYHAHLHVVPLPGIPDPIAKLKERFPHKRLDALCNISYGSNRNSPYLFCEDFNSNRYRFSIGNLQSQYMRRLLAKAIGTKDWNWRSAGREERLLATIRRLSGQFDSNKISFTPTTHDGL
jgi:diadenosine tetraphosphate (Ap4A) HIT family hydrolase